MSMHLAPVVIEELQSLLGGELTQEEFARLPMREIAQLASRQLGSNLGIKGAVSDDGGAAIGGEQTYPDPEG